MSRITTGIILKLPNGKYVRTYQTQTHVGTRDHIQETPDIDCATVFRTSLHDHKMRKLVNKHFDGVPFTELQVEITRTIKILQEGDQPCLPL